MGKQQVEVKPTAFSLFLLRPFLGIHRGRKFLEPNWAQTSKAEFIVAVVVVAAAIAAAEFGVVWLHYNSPIFQTYQNSVKLEPSPFLRSKFNRWNDAGRMANQWHRGTHYYRRTSKQFQPVQWQACGSRGFSYLLIPLPLRLIMDPPSSCSSHFLTRFGSFNWLLGWLDRSGKKGNWLASVATLELAFTATTVLLFE